MEEEILKANLWILVLIVTVSLASKSLAGPADTVWTRLFNGADLADWDIKIKGQPLHSDTLNTIRVAPCVNDTGKCLEMNYANYQNWNDSPWTHLGYKVRPYSYYYLRAKYQILGLQNQVPNRPSYSFEQCAILLHSQAISTMTQNQDFALAIEDQIYGPDYQGTQGTSNLCLDGMAFQDSPTGPLNHNHCINSSPNTRVAPPAWTTISALVMADSIIRFYVADQLVKTFYKPVQLNEGSIHNGTVSIVNNTPVTGGFIALQGEGASFRFKTLELVNLQGCMNPNSPNYKSYYVKNDTAACNTTAVQEVTPPLSKRFSFNASRQILSLNFEGKNAVKISDLNGKTVWEGSDVGKQSFDLSLIQPKGIYFLSVKNQRQVFTQKVILGD